VGAFLLNHYEKEVMKTKRILYLPILFTALVFVLLFITFAHAATLEVGTEKPYPTIQSAINATFTGDTVLVYDGTYTENIDFLGRAITVRSVKGASVTIIDSRNTNGSVVTFKSGEGLGAALDGFTIINGIGTGLLEESKGGGIYCYNSSPTITNCIVTENGANSSGGGIYCYNSSPTITNCIISKNRASIGGGIYCYYSSSPIITNCTISGNEAIFYGGGIYISSTSTFAYSSPTITNCTISGNKAGGGGGGIHCDNYSLPTITNCTISFNEATFDGGGIFCYYSSSPIITNCIILGNKAIQSTESSGGGIGCDYSSPTITNCTISFNEAIFGGGIKCFRSSSPTITNCLIVKNVATSGGGIHSSPSNYPNIKNCTLYANNAVNDGGGICNDDTSCSVTNCILWGGTAKNGKEIFPAGSAGTTYSDIDQTGYAGQAGNIAQDPLFVDPENSNFHLQANSPCVDAATSDGAPTTDMEGNPRYDSPIVPNSGSGQFPYYDMGAFELQSGTYSISGSVKLNDSGLSGVTIDLSGNGSESTITNSFGIYSFTALNNGTYIVTPRKSYCIFSPLSREVTINGADITGVDFTVTILTGCISWADVIAKYNAYVSGQAAWNDVITCYNQYVSK
jgi:parallel beta-helix repeat protein